MGAELHHLGVLILEDQNQEDHLDHLVLQQEEDPQVQNEVQVDHLDNQDSLPGFDHNQDIGQDVPGDLVVQVGLQDEVDPFDLLDLEDGDLGIVHIPPAMMGDSLDNAEGVEGNYHQEVLDIDHVVDNLGWAAVGIHLMRDAGDLQDIHLKV